MVDLSFKIRESTEEFSNECRLNPEVRFYTTILQDENYAIFATKEEDDSSQSKIRILFFLNFGAFSICEKVYIVFFK